MTAANWWSRISTVPTKSSCRPAISCFILRLACIWSRRSPEGTRVASFFWLQSMVRDAHARSMIFDLDTAIQALVERLGRDDPETVKLTGIYHNLIRHWAEV